VIPTGWRVWIDTGGTFTDAVGVAPDGTVRRAKVLSNSSLRGTIRYLRSADRVVAHTAWSGPRDLCVDWRFRVLAHPDPVGIRIVGYDPDGGTIDLAHPLHDAPFPGAAFEIVAPEEAPVVAARLLTGTAARDPLPVASMRLATTLGTNALLERRGVPTALFVNAGFADLLAIGDQSRPDLFTLDVRRPEPLAAAVVEVRGRLAPDGTEELPLDLAEVRERARALLADGIRSAAVALLHAWRDPRHERAVADALREAGFAHVSRSSDLARSIGAVTRTRTAVVDATLAPIVGGYLDRVGAKAGDAALHVMTSAGGLTRPADFRPKDSLLSGPAGGVVGAAAAARRSGFGRVLAFDMGGTSTDVARWAGDFEYVREHVVGDARVAAPALAIESVAAGGGSTCWFDGDRLRVGPASAGASPGPACYGAGGPLTVTDVNLLLGRLDPARFGIPVEEGEARRAFEAVRDAVRARHPDAHDDEALLHGFLDVADERMADAIRTISVRRGFDPADHVLVAFGGAGPQSACGVATRLGIDTVLVPADTGLLSAWGLGRAVLERFAERPVLRPLDEFAGELPAALADLEREALSRLAQEDVAPDDASVRRRIAHLRFVGQDTAIEVEIEPDADLAVAFADRHAALYGHRPAERRVELVALQVVASTRPPDVPAPVAPPPPRSAEPLGTRRGWFDGAWREVALHDRAALRPGDTLAGPALVLEAHSVTVVAPGWTARADGALALVLERTADPAPRLAAADDARPEAVRLELFTRRFEAIAREMGERLRRTAVSTNVKERLDFSCAILDPDGRLLVNAPHIPVHLGALGLAVRRLIATTPMAPGDVVVVNHPAFGGSHLPDVTVVTPVAAATGEPLGYVASRAHHAEIGGTRPGSMPPTATRLAEEGAVLPPTHAVRAGVADWTAVRALLTAGPHPTRNVADNLADLEAAAAANHAGAVALRALAEAAGPAVVLRYMRALTDLAARRVREALAALPDGRREAEQFLDDGTPIRVAVEIASDRAVIDFAGSGGVHPGNLNATPAIVASATMFVVRLLVRDPIPLNEGLLDPIDVRLPEGFLNPPFVEDPARCPAVVGGNVETSQRIVDALTLALRLAACSQGTMNNVLFGDDRLGYYETLCGGMGAGATYDGASAVHSNMTNTRITDPEVLEHRYPVRVERFAVRRGSGGAGAHRGGDGVVRALRFLAPMRLSVLTQHRVEAPFGMDGGQPGARGRQWVERADGTRVDLGPVDGADVDAGDRFVIETPGGGGWGRP